jgi:Fis family transcriptional regulator
MNRRKSITTLAHSTELHVTQYLFSLKGEQVVDLHSMVMSEVESALFATVLKQVNGNQTQAAKMMGMNRGTMRTKLKEYKLI